MIKVVLDTDILIDSAHGYAPWVKEITKEQEKITLIVPTIVIAEYLSAKENDNKKYIERTRGLFHLFTIQELTASIAEILGTLLRKKTYLPGVSTADLIVASTSLYLEAELATRNIKDFARIPGLRFFDPKSLD